MNSVGKHPVGSHFFISFISVYLVMHSLTWQFLNKRYNWLLQQNPDPLGAILNKYFHRILRIITSFLKRNL